MSIPLWQVVPLQSQLTSKPTSKAARGTGTHTPEHGSTAYVSTARPTRHTAGPLHVLKKPLTEGQGEQDAEYTMPLVTTGICLFRRVQTKWQT